MKLLFFINIKIFCAFITSCFVASFTYALTPIPQFLRNHYSLQKSLPEELRSYNDFAQYQHKLFIDISNNNSGSATDPKNQRGTYTLDYDPGRYFKIDPTTKRLFSWGVNCYGYACNRGMLNDENKVSVYNPGAISISTFNVRVKNEVNDVLYAALEDGLTLTPSPLFPSYPVFFTVAPGKDYHWYRLDSNKRWSHKPGVNLPATLDGSKNPILNPLEANHDLTLFNSPNYSELGCFLWVPFNLGEHDNSIFKIQELPHQR